MNMRVFTSICMFFILSYASAQTDTIKSISTVSFNVSYIGETVINHRGGIQKGSCYEGMANLTALFETNKAHLWKGGKLFINTAYTHGGNPSKDFIGDFQGASNIEADNLTYFHEMWYSQLLGRTEVTIGLQDLNSEFASSEYATTFLNSSFGVHSTIADNIVAPIFPLTAFGVQIIHNFNEHLALKMITFDGFPDDFSKNNPYNLHWKFDSEDGLLNIAELTWKPVISQLLEGKYSVGAYTHHHITKEEYSDHNIWEITNYGFYMTGDQLLRKNSDGSYLSAFLQASVSPYQRNENWYYIGVGINKKGVFSNDIKDLLGIAIASAGFDNYKGNETAIEVTYQYELMKQLSVQPDIQYIINPSGTESILQNALVTVLRFIIEI